MAREDRVNRSSNERSPEEREHAVRTVPEPESEQESQWAATASIAEKTDGPSETL